MPIGSTIGGSVGASTASSICSISPSDQVGTIENLLSRIEQLEQDVAELKAQNTGAVQLSDISQSVGWAYDVTYMGVAGWTMTEYGTLIPPDGMSLSSLGIVPPFIPGIAGANLQFAYFKSSSTPIAFGGPTSATSVAWTETKDTNSIASVFSSTGIKVTTSGFYIVSLAISYSTDNAAEGKILADLGFSGQPSGALTIDGLRNVGPRIDHPISVTVGPASDSLTSTRFMYIDSGATGVLTVSTSGTGGQYGIGGATVNLIKIHAEQL